MRSVEEKSKNFNIPILWSWLIKQGKFWKERSLILYFCSYLFLLLIVDHQNYKLKVFDYLKMPIDYLILFSEGKELFDRSKFEEYIEYYKATINYFPGYPEAYSLLGFCYYHTGRPQQAIDLYEKAAELKKDFFWSHYNRGLLYFKMKNYKKAVEAFEEAIMLDPNRTIKLVAVPKSPPGEEKGKIAKDIQKVDLIEFGKDFDVRLKSANEDFPKLIILSYYHVQDYSMMKTKALQFLDSNIPGKDLFYYWIGFASYHFGLYEDAVWALTESGTLNPNRAQTFYFLGLALKELHKDELSTIAFRKADLLKTPGESWESLEFDMEKNLKLQIF